MKPNKTLSGTSKECSPEPTSPNEQSPSRLLGTYLSRTGFLNLLNPKVIHSNFVSPEVFDTGYAFEVSLVKSVQELCREKGYEIVRIKCMICLDAELSGTPVEESRIAAKGDYSVAIVQNEKGENEAVVFLGGWIEVSPANKNLEI